MAEDFVIRIRADDAATATVKRIQAALGKVTAPVEKAQKRVGQLGEVGQARMDKLRKGFDGVANAARGVVDRIVEIIPGLTAISGAASLAGLSALAVKFGNFGFSLNKSSQLLGMNAQDLAAWHVAAKRAGVSAEEFDSSMSSSQMAIRGAAYGADPQAMMMLTKMGVQIQRNQDGSIDYLKTQRQIMEALRRQKSVEGQRDAANALGMGALLPMIQRGTYDADKARAMRKGLVPSADEIAKAQQFHQDINDLEDSVSGLGNSIGSKLVPILDPLVRGFSNWLDQNRVRIADEIGAAVQKFAAWLQSIDWASLASQARGFLDAIGGVKGVLIALAAITLAGPISGVLNLTRSVAGLAEGLGTLAPAIAAAAGPLAAMAAALTAAYVVIEKLQASTESGHFVSRQGNVAPSGKEGAPASKKSFAERMQDAWRSFVGDGKNHFVGRQEAHAHGSTSGSTYQFTDSPVSSAPPAAAPSAPDVSGTIPAALAQKAGPDAVMLALQNQQRYGVPASVTLAQYGLESGFGHSMPAGSNNPFGIKASAGQPYVEAETTEVIDGVAQRVTQRFAKFDSLADAFDAHAKLLATGSAYTLAQQHTDDPEAYAQALTGHYATDPDYGAKLIAEMDGMPPPAVPAGAGTQAAAGGSSQTVRHDVAVTFNNMPPGTRVEAQSSDGGYLPTRINYAMNTDYGAIP